MQRSRQARIVATLGPASQTEEIVENLFLEGVDVFRLNFSHGDHETHDKSIQMIRGISKKHNCHIGILADLQGPKLRIGTFDVPSIILSQGDHFQLDLDKTPGTQQRVCFPHAEIYSVLQKGSSLLLDDGKVQLKVIQVEQNKILTEVTVGGSLSNRKGVNIPDVLLPISSMTEKDHKDLEFALKKGVDWVALSFVQKPQDISEAQQIIQGRAKIVAKIEKPKAITFIEEIVELSDGVMVARGDLGVEIPPEEVPPIQKQIVRCARSKGKPVIVATQMLDSMVNAPTPTRAEASDVATAIYDGADAVMLSAESASGKHPVASVSIMDRIIKQVEKDPYYHKLLEVNKPELKITTARAITAAAKDMSLKMPVCAIITFTDSGMTALAAAQQRPQCPILALTPSSHVAAQLNLGWGIKSSVIQNPITDFADMLIVGTSKAKEEGLLKPHQYLIMIAGVPFGRSGTTNILRIVQIGEDLSIENVT